VGQVKNNGFKAGIFFAVCRVPKRNHLMATNILVVDDDRLNRQLISKVLRQEGYQVVEACDGALALEILQMLRFDLVITDFVMPKLNGIEFVEQIHTLQPRTPIIFITGFVSVFSGEAILEEVTEVLPKPFELGVLRSTVQRVLDSTS
jgi:CheY-like chemotaxis protein